MPLIIVQNVQDEKSTEAKLLYPSNTAGLHVQAALFT